MSSASNTCKLGDPPELPPELVLLSAVLCNAVYKDTNSEVGKFLAKKSEAPTDAKAEICASLCEYGVHVDTLERHVIKCSESDHCGVWGDTVFLKVQIGRTGFVVLRGSITTRDWLDNLRAWTAVFGDTGASLHSGFDKRADQLHFNKDIVDWIRPDMREVRERLRQDSQNYPDLPAWVLADYQPVDRVFVVGHSLGGAIAQIVTLRVALLLTAEELGRAAVQSITFGSPLWASTAMAALCEERGLAHLQHAFVNRCDTVPPLLRALPGYTAVGSYTFLSKTPCSSLEIAFCEQAHAALDAIRAQGTDRDDHSMVRYIEQLQSTFGIRTPLGPLSWPLLNADTPRCSRPREQLPTAAPLDEKPSKQGRIAQSQLQCLRNRNRQAAAGEAVK